MSTSPPTGDLTLEQCLVAFHEALHHGDRPDPRAFLPAGPERQAALVELIHADLEYQLKHGEPAGVKDYLARYPELASQPDALRSLAAAESHLRGRREPEPLPADRYELLGELGRGGMGVVYKARQTSLKRLVALKMVLAGAHAGPEQLARFRSEAEAVARLQHANIVQIHEVGEHNGLPYFSLEFVDGGSLDRRLQQAPVADRDAARLVETLARAVSYAHQRGIIHRDLKPANVLLQIADSRVQTDRPEERPSGPAAILDLQSAIPKITDFGLAKQLDAASGQTQSGAIMGTPSYMAPEQAEGRTRDIGPLTDVYALGAILYELLTGGPPFRAETPWETVKLVLAQEPIPPSRLRPRVHRDLETVCLKALAKEPAGRYSSALALAQDLERYQAGESILARREGVVRKLGRKVRRSPVASALIGLVLLAAGVTAFFALRAGASSRLAVVKTFEARLEGEECTPARLVELEAGLENLGRQAPEDVGPIRERLYHRYAEFIRDSFHRPRLAAADVARVEEALQLLAVRDADLEHTVHEEFRERLGRPQAVLDLKHPFDLATPENRSLPVFDSPRVRVEGNALVCRTPAGAKSDTVVLSRVPCVGHVELQAVFDRLSWKDDGPLGLTLNAGPAKGYAFVLGPLDPAEAALSGAVPGEWLTLRIVRNGIRLREQQLPAAALPPGWLRLTATRGGNRLAVQVNGAPPLEFQDPFPPESYEFGVFGLVWPDGVQLVALQASCQLLPAAPSPLERGDDFYARSRLPEALEEYRSQAAAARSPEVAQESAYKQGLCLLGLQRPDEARQVLERTAGAKGERWPPLASCQLWLLHVNQKRFDEADALFEGLRLHYRFEELARFLPEDVVRRILIAYVVTGANWLLFNSATVRNCERAVAIRELIRADERDQLFWARHALCRAYRMAGQEKRALQTAEEMVGSLWALGGSRLGIYVRAAYGEFTWLLCSQGEARRALEALAEYDRGKNPPVADLLVARARVHAALREWDGAEKDLKEFFGRADVKASTEYQPFAEACLLEGFLHERRGDPAGAQAAWRRALYRSWRRDHPDQPADLAPASANTTTFLDNLMAASLTGELTDAEGEAIVLSLLSFFRSGVPAHFRSLGVGVVPPSVLREMWRTPRGREWARKLAFRDLSFPESVRIPVFLAGAELVHQGALPGELSPEHDALIWKVIEDGFAVCAAGKMGKTELFQLLATWKGIDNALGWAGVAPKLEPSVRGPLAYLAGHRYRRVLQKPREAETFFRTAWEDAAQEPPNPVLRRLAQAELDRPKDK